jgi:hypothetical protein
LFTWSSAPAIPAALSSLRFPFRHWLFVRHSGFVIRHFARHFEEDRDESI